MEGKSDLCDHIPKKKLVNIANEELAKAISSSFDLLPLYENSIFEHNFKEHYSLQQNQSLACRWAEYKRTFATRASAPIQLPDNKALHFHNNGIKFRPVAQFERQDHKMRLKPGPGVDDVGQMPIPHEALMKRGTSVKNDGNVNVNSNKMAKTVRKKTKKFGAKIGGKVTNVKS